MFYLDAVTAETQLRNVWKSSLLLLGCLTDWSLTVCPCLIV